MNNDPIPDPCNVVRHCLRKYVDEDGDITSAAFKLRHEKNEEYLSVMWLEYFTDPTFQNKLDKVRGDLQHRRSLKPRDRLATLNVGVTRDYVMSSMSDGRILTFKHMPGRHNDNSHSGVFNIEPNGDEVAELMVESVSDVSPAVP